MNKIKTFISGYKFLLGCVWHASKAYVILNLISNLVAVPVALIASVSVAQKVIDRVLAGGTFLSVLGIIAVYFAVFVVASLIQNGVGLFYSQWKIEEITMKIKKELHAQALRTDFRWLDDPAFFQSINLSLQSIPGQTISAVNNTSQILGMVTGSLAMLGLIAETGLLLAAIVLAGIIGASLLQARQVREILKQMPEDAAREQLLDYIARIYQEQDSASELKATRLPKLLDKRFDAFCANHIAAYRGIMKRSGFWGLSSEWLRKLMDYGVILYAAVGLYAGWVQSVGVFATLIAAAAALTGALAPLSTIAMTVSRIMQTSTMLHAFFDLASPIETSTGADAPSGAFGVEFKAMDFAYPERDPIYRDFSLSIAPGEKIAIVGENGAGKTTLMKLLLRLYDPSSGEIRINGQPLASYDIHKLRERIGVAFQESHYYALSLRDNLSFYGEADDETLKTALRSVGLGQLCEMLDTEMTREYSQDGIVLSGGERQKLALARLLSADFGLLLLDEPSSALDPLAEYELMKTILSLAENKTTIMIAHRLSTVRDMDRIIVLREGCAVEQGSHDELMAMKGYYYEMFTKQGENYQLS